jgi:signal transduction histidine kinase
LLKPGSGRLIPVQILSNPFAVNGSTALYRTVITDLTERKRGEEELRNAHKELEKRIHERTVELERTNQELEEEIKTRRRLEGEILEISDREQRRMGQDLHDGLCQHLAALSFMAKAIAIRLRRERQSEAAEVDELSALLTDAVGQTRTLARGLHPVEVDSSGLMSALQELAASVNNGSTTARFECARPVAIEDSALALNLYRIAQEAIGNAVKHSRGKHIDIRLASRKGEIVLSVMDDGKGLPQPPTKSQGMGMHIMNYRAKMIGASIKVAPGESGGTCVACSIPIRKQ